MFEGKIREGELIVVEKKILHEEDKIEQKKNLAKIDWYLDPWWIN